MSLSGGKRKYYETRLSPFAIQKFTRAFKECFDFDKNGVWEAEDLQVMVDKWRKHSEVEHDDAFYHEMFQFAKANFDMMKKNVNKIQRESGEKVEDVDHITLEGFLGMHADKISLKKMDDFPKCLQAVPSVWYQIIDRNGDGIIRKEEYRRFYKDFCNVPLNALDKYTDEAFDVMTKGGTIDLNLERFGEVILDYFTNQNPDGIGKYFLGYIED